jgi:predicted amidohydrolase
MKIALAQLNVGININQNVAKSINMMEKAANLGADLICYPEVHLYPFFPQFERQNMEHIAIGIDDSIMKRFQEKCLAMNIMAVPNIYLKEGGKKYDASIPIDSNGKIMGISKMVHIVQTKRFFEQDYYTPSDTGFIVYNTPSCKLGIVICFDRHFPESIRTCVLKGAELILIPTVNTKDEDLEMFEWELRVQAMQNSVFIAMCNRVGIEDEMEFCGESIIIDPNGDIIKKANDSEELILADLNFDQFRKTQKKRRYMDLRRPEVYSLLTKT